MKCPGFLNLIGLFSIRVMRIYALIINHCSDKQLRQFELPSCVHKNTAIIGQFKFTSAINYGHNQKFLGAGQDSWNRDTIINIS